MSGPVLNAAGPSTLGAATQTTVSTSAVQIAAANSQRRKVTIQNVHATGVMRVGLVGVTATTGLRVIAGAEMTLVGDGSGACPTQALYAIRDGGTDATACVAEFTR